MKIKNLLCLTVMTISASLAHTADKEPLTKYEFAQYAALSEVCSELVPAKKAVFMASRYAYEANNATAIKSAGKDADYDRMIRQYKNMMLAADTVYGVELCEQIDFNEAPVRLVSPKGGELKGG